MEKTCREEKARANHEIEDHPSIPHSHIFPPPISTTSTSPPLILSMDSPMLNRLFRRIFRHPACQHLRPVHSSLAPTRRTQQCRSFLTRRGKRAGHDAETTWFKRGDYPRDISEELEVYPLVTAKELRHRRERPRQVKMTTREFIEGIIYPFLSLHLHR